MFRPLSFLLPFLLAISAFCFALGLTMPLVSLDRLIVFTERPSLVGLVHGLWVDGEAALAGIVAAFSILLPAVKILVLHYVVCRGRKSRSLALLGVASKWSMMDVLLVALVIFSAKTSGLATASALPGLWFYAIATLSSALAAVLVQK